MSDYGFSEIECKIILDQIERRARYRKEFLRLRTDPCKHANQEGYVFDPAIQRFMSMKTCQFEYFKPCPSTIMSGIFMIIIPMVAYGTMLKLQRDKFEKDCRCGKIKYRDRLFKLQ